MSGFPPKLFLIGAQKAATTLLADLLAGHSQIALGRVKEVNFFHFTGHFDMGMDWYRAQFPNTDVPWLLDASVNHAYAIFSRPERLARYNVPQRIKAVSPEARFIYVLREPVDRAYSAYWHTVRNGVEKRPPGKALTPPSPYLDVSDYAAQLELYLPHFPLDRFLILKQREVTQTPLAAVNRVCAHLGLAPMSAEDLPPLSIKNAGFQLSGTAKLMLRLTGDHKRFEAFQRGLKAVVPTPLQAWMKRQATRPIPPIDQDLRARLAAHMHPRMRALESLTGLDFSEWPTLPEVTPDRPASDLGLVQA